VFAETGFALLSVDNGYVVDRSCEFLDRQMLSD
jgi:hypothetical protein